MKNEKISNGVWPVMLTPFKGRDQIDWAGVDALTEWYISQGVHGLFSACLSSEALEMNDANKLALVRRVVDIAGGRVPVVGGVMGVETREKRMEMAQQVVADGAAAAVLTFCDVASEQTSDADWIDEMDRHLEISGGIPMGVYECPWPYHRTMTPLLTEYAALQPQFLFLKETSGNLSEIERKCQSGALSGLKVFSADATTILDAYNLGVSGFSGLQTNLWPALHVALFECRKENPELAARIQAFFCEYDWMLSKSYPASAKQYLKTEYDLPLDSLSFLNNAAVDESDQGWIDQAAEAIRAFHNEVKSAGEPASACC